LVSRATVESEAARGRNRRRRFRANRVLRPEMVRSPAKEIQNLKIARLTLLDQPEQRPSRPHRGDDRERDGEGLHDQARRRCRPAHDRHQGQRHDASKYEHREWHDPAHQNTLVDILAGDVRGFRGHESCQICRLSSRSSPLARGLRVRMMRNLVLEVRKEEVMDGERFDALIQSLGDRATRRGVLGVLGGVAVLGLNKGGVHAAPAGKVAICHATGSGSYRRIEISANAVDAHLAHGDAVPGAPVPGGGGQVFGDDCSVEDAPPTRVCSGPMEFGPNGWGGWSCPPGTSAVGGEVLPETAEVTSEQVAGPGSSWPHYTFGPTESGYVVQNGPTGQTLNVCVFCS
jgi:hypothetical protein